MSCQPGDRLDRCLPAGCCYLSVIPKYLTHQVLKLKKEKAKDQSIQVKKMSEEQK
jgi:hypothetical protein